ncbi:MAG: folate-binding protein YgfZ [Planctomycetota bacterium]|jgi:folate-binding protein YgfZ
MTPSSLLGLYLSRDIALTPAPEGRGLELPADHGNAVAELAAANSGAALFDASARGQLLLTGSDSGDLLQRILAGDVRSLAAGQIQENLLLTPKGRVRFSFTVERHGDVFRLSTAPGDAGDLAKALDAFVFAEDVTFEEASAAHAPLELLGPGAAKILEALIGSPMDLAPGSHAEFTWNGATLAVAHCRVLGANGWRLDAAAEGVAALWQALAECGATPAGLDAREALRTQNVAALVGVELPSDGEQAPYPQEALLEDAFSLAKGCYVGQEVVAKLDTYGGLNRKLTAFEVDSREPIDSGTALLTNAGEEAGVVTTWSPVPGQDSARILAYVKVRQADAGPFRAGPSGQHLKPLSESLP